MKAEQGKLRLDTKYTILSTHHAHKTNGNYDIRICENCGHILTNWAIVECAEKHTYLIGLDCAAIICTMTNGVAMDKLELKEAKKRMARETRFLKFLSDKCKSAIIDENSISFYHFVTEKWHHNWTVRITKTDNNMRYLADYPNITTNTVIE
jgi:hypothetical protein